MDLAVVTSDALDDLLRRLGSFSNGPASPARTLVNLYGSPMHLATFAQDRGENEATGKGHGPVLGGHWSADPLART